MANLLVKPNLAEDFQNGAALTETLEPTGPAQ